LSTPASSIVRLWFDFRTLNAAALAFSRSPATAVKGTRLRPITYAWTKASAAGRRVKLERDTQLPTSAGPRVPRSLREGCRRRPPAYFRAPLEPCVHGQRAGAGDGEPQEERQVLELIEA